MKVSHCKFITTLPSHLRAEMKERSPACIKTTAVITQGKELLLPSNYGGRHMV